MNRLLRACVFLSLVAFPLVLNSQMNNEQRQYHWELISAYLTSESEVGALVSFCTDYDAEIDAYLRENFHIFGTSFNSVMRSDETHNSRWWEAISSTWHKYRRELVMRVRL